MELVSGWLLGRAVLNVMTNQVSGNPLGLYIVLGFSEGRMHHDDALISQEP